MKKRLAALLLSVCMLSSLGTSVFADETEVTEPVIEETAVEETEIEEVDVESSIEEEVVEESVVEEIEVIEEEAFDVTSVSINSTNFPDANFRKYISDKFDTNKNGVLSEKEINSVTKMITARGNLSDEIFDTAEETYGKFSSFKGIEFFTELKEVFLVSSNTKSINLSSLKKLEHIIIDDNTLTSIDLSGNTSAICIEIWCMNDNLSLKLPKTSALKELDLYASKNVVNFAEFPELKTLVLYGPYTENVNFLSGNTKLENLHVMSYIKSIDVSKNIYLKELFLSGEVNVLSKIDLSKNSKLEKLLIRGGSYTTLDLSNKPNLIFVMCPSRETNFTVDITNSTHLLEVYNGTVNPYDYTGPNTCYAGAENERHEFSLENVIINGVLHSHKYVNNVCTCGKVDNVTSLVKVNGVFKYYKDGKFSPETTLVKYNGSFWYVKNGILCKDETLVKYNGSYWYVKDGKLCKDETLVKYNGSYWYVKDGKLCKETTLVKYNNAYWYVKDGKLCKDETIIKYNNAWWYVKDGKLCKDTALVKYNGSFWYCKDGKMQSTYSGVVYIGGVTKTVKNGKVV